MAKLNETIATPITQVSGVSVQGTRVDPHPSPLPPAPSLQVQKGILHAFFAYDWGDAIDLEAARRIEPAELLVLPRRRRTPSYFTFHPAPLRFHWKDIQLTLPEIGLNHSEALVTVFDFAAVSLDLNIPFELSSEALIRLAGWLAEPVQLLSVARATLIPLYERIKSAIRNPKWHETMVEEYFVFQFTRDCEETLQAIEFANLQLLELRHIDDQLDAILKQTEQMMTQISARRLPHWHGPSNEQRRLGEMHVEAATLFERSTNALKLVGDPYLARVFRLLTERFRLPSWEAAIQRKLEAVEDIYQVVTDQAEHARSTTLELIVIALIAVEIVLALIRH